MHTTTLKKDYVDKPHEPVPCPLCVHGRDFVLATKGYPGIPVRNVICTGCGLIRITPRMTAEGYKDFYKEDFFEYLNPYARPAYVEEIEHTTDDSYETPTKRLTIPYLRPWVKQGGRVLDVGAGLGQMLYLLRKEKNVTFVGIEPDPFSRSVAKEKMGIDLIDMTIEAYLETETGLFDFIYLEQVFEHLLSPLETLTKLRKILSPEGVIYIGVPNAWNPQIPMKIFYQLAHTYNYTPATMSLFAERAGLKIVDVRDPEGYPLEVLLAHRDASYTEVPPERTVVGTAWKSLVYRLKRKEIVNHVRGLAKVVTRSLGGEQFHQIVRKALDSLTRYRY